MPREIDCPDCGGRGEICASECGFRMSLEAGTCTYKTCNWKFDCKNKNCKNGKITLYTDEELQEAIKQGKTTLLQEIKNYFISQSHYRKWLNGEMTVFFYAHQVFDYLNNKREAWEKTDA